jgi:anti-anti-sigma factor
MHTVTDGGPRLSLSTRTEHGHVIVTLSGALDTTSAPALREQLLGLLRPAASRLVINLSAVHYADASGLAVLVGTAHRARMLGGFLHLAAPVPAVARVLRLTGLHRQLDTYPTVQAAMTDPPSAKHRHYSRPDPPPAQRTPHQCRHTAAAPGDPPKDQTRPKTAVTSRPPPVAISSRPHRGPGTPITA